ncbi:hypothetical protein [Fibrobacter sp.]|uniref:hypothetical protein n=1 Tax=Fibrobacter sp. TaxID=35828 RepID=UPI003865D185
MLHYKLKPEPDELPYIAAQTAFERATAAENALRKTVAAVSRQNAQTLRQIVLQPSLEPVLTGADSKNGEEWYETGFCALTDSESAVSGSACYSLPESGPAILELVNARGEIRRIRLGESGKGERVERAFFTTLTVKKGYNNIKLRIVCGEGENVKQSAENPGFVLSVCGIGVCKKC